MNHHRSILIIERKAREYYVVALAPSISLLLGHARRPLQALAIGAEPTSRLVSDPFWVLSISPPYSQIVTHSALRRLLRSYFVWLRFQLNFKASPTQARDSATSHGGMILRFWSLKRNNHKGRVYNCPTTRIQQV